MKILIVDDEVEIQEILAFSIETEIESDILYASSGNEAVELLKKTDDINLVICDYNMPNGNGAVVYDYIIDSGHQTRYVLCTSELPDDVFSNKNDQVFLCHIVKPNVFEGIEEMLELYTKIEGANKVIPLELEYAPINLSFVTYFIELPCDVFVKVSESKFLKVFNEGERVESEDLNSYKKKEVSKLYIESNKIKLIVDFVSTKLEKLIESKSIPDEKKVFDAYSIIHSTVSSIGLSPKILRVTELSVKMTLEIFESDKSNIKLFHHIFHSDECFLTKHSILLAYVSCGILSKLPWDSYENRNKLTLASFYHDSMIDDPNFDEEDDSHADYEEILRTHSIKSSELVSGFDHLPSDIDRIIQDHHEKPDGSGVPRGLTAVNINPLSSIFIFSHDVVLSMLRVVRNGTELTKEATLSELDSELYSSGTFKKCLKAFEELELFDK